MNRILFCSGKVYYDLLAGREERKAENVAIVRTEMLYPFPQAQIESSSRSTRRMRTSTGCRKSRATWGPGASSTSVCSRFSIAARECCTMRDGRRAQVLPPGTTKRHEQEQSDLVSDSFAPRPVTRKPKRVKIVAKRTVKK